MNQYSYISKHCSERLKERSKLSNEKLIEILDCGFYLKLWDDYELEHILMYSCVDKDYYVVVQHNSGLVITILNKNYYKDYVISEHNLSVAKNQNTFI